MLFPNPTAGQTENHVSNVCPGYRKKTCHFKAVDGVLLDEFIVQQLSNLSDEDSEHFKEILEIKVEEVLEQSNSEQEYALLKRKKEKLQTDIIAQTKNMREVDESIRCYLQEDIQRSVTYGGDAGVGRFGEGTAMSQHVAHAWKG